MAYFLENPRRWIPLTALGRMLKTWRVGARVFDVKRIFRERGGDVFNATTGGGLGHQKRSWYWFSPTGSKPDFKPGEN